jgi:transcriptional regulator with XRE-family HTH domain
MEAILRASIAFQVVTLRLARGWTQAKLAEQAGLSVPEIARIEKPTGPGMNLSSLLKIAKAFDCAFICRFTDWDVFVSHMVGLIPPSAYDQNAISALAEMKEGS